MSDKGLFFDSVYELELDDANERICINLDMINKAQNSLLNIIDSGKYQAVVIKGNTNSFCDGFAIDELNSNSLSQYDETIDAYMQFLNLICDAPIPIISYVQGDVSGGGLGIVAASDIVLAAENVRFMLPEVVVGMIPALITPFLLRRISIGRLRYLTLSSQKIDVHEAHLIGLVDYIEKSTDNLALKKHLKRIVHSSSAALAHSKHYFNEIYNERATQHNDIAIKQAKSWIRRDEAIDEINSLNFNLLGNK